MAKSKRKPWEKAPAVGAPTVDVFALRQSFLIICEGQETEKNYFEAFRANKSVEDFWVEGAGRNTLSLVQKAVKVRKDKEEKRGEAFDQVWCVFDRDDFPSQNFNAAITLALKEGFQVAYSNQAFEIWYLLHFDAHNAALSRHDYKAKLTPKLGFRYEKNSALTYPALQSLGDEARAMKFADNLIRDWIKQSGLNPESDNPSTTVHFLVRELRNQRPRSQSDNALCEELHQLLKRRAGFSDDGSSE